MYSAARMAGRPPHIDRVPRYAPLSRLSGATPTNAATSPRFRRPNSGRCVSSIDESTGPTPGTVRSRSSWARHMGDERIIFPMSSSRSFIWSLSQRMCAWICGRTRFDALRRRFCSDFSMPESWRRRSTKARNSRVSSSGRVRTGGSIASPNWASTRASIASVLANLPVARAKLRTCRGLTSETGSSANCNSVAANISYPPVASNTTLVGSTDTACSTRAAMPSASFEYWTNSPPGIIAITRSVDETSIPTCTCSEIAAPPARMIELLVQAQSCNIRPRVVGAHNCSGSGSLRRDDPAEARSPTTKNGTICHVLF